MKGWVSIIEFTNVRLCALDTPGTNKPRKTRHCSNLFSLHSRPSQYIEQWAIFCKRSRALVYYRLEPSILQSIQLQSHMPYWSQLHLPCWPLPHLPEPTHIQQSHSGPLLLRLSQSFLPHLRWVYHLTVDRTHSIRFILLSMPSSISSLGPDYLAQQSMVHVGFLDSWWPSYNSASWPPWYLRPLGRLPDPHMSLWPAVVQHQVLLACTCIFILYQKWSQW